ncbi:hypothetical protein N7532_006825 [Penicillium argentinense]|uniref:Uncharacterized protein n=1 Tax=Penicillium argentinense TaxID=1131581 RepID=A0A9W9KB63_9EURO|nr:uncharacterized protein N7532_006825 [Penicillium argentinense]KAJ5099824.1 hypothetical protein N7532_006825 [Penicillium argentinense]
MEGRSDAPNSGPLNPIGIIPPHSPGGSVIVTTRSFNASYDLTTKDHVILVESMNEPLATALFRVKLPPHVRGEDVAPISQALHGHPLSIVMAAACINSPTLPWDLRGFHEEIKRRESFRREKKGTLPVMQPFHNISQIVLDTLKQVDRPALDLLCYLSFFDPQGVPESLLADGPGDVSKFREGQQRSSQIEGLAPEIFLLRNLRLIHVTPGDRTIVIHDLLRRVVKEWMETNLYGEDPTEPVKSRFIKNLSHRFVAEEHANWKKCRSLFPHVQVAIDDPPSRYMKQSLLQWATLLHAGARYAGNIGKATVMARMAMKAMHARHDILGPNHLESIDAEMTLRLAYLLQGRWSKAEMMAKHRVEHCDRVLGPEHPASLSASGHLALAKWYQGQWDDAERPNLKLLETSRRALGRDHPDTLTIMSNLAMIYEQQGRLKEAEDMNFVVRETRRRVLGSEHPSTLASMNNLAVIYMRQGRLEEAENMNSHLLRIRTRSLGQDHPVTLTSMTNLASVYKAEGRFDEAEALYHLAVSISKKIKGGEHRDTLGVMGNLAAIYQAKGRLVEAEELETQVLLGRQKVLGNEHPDTVKSLASLAARYFRRSQLELAEATQTQVIGFQEAQLGPEHPDVLLSLVLLASIFRARGRLEESEEIYLRVISGMEKHFGPEHPSTIDGMEGMALVLIHQGRFEEAEALQLRSIASKERVLGSEHPSVLTSRATLALNYQHQNRLFEAGDIYSHVLVKSLKVFGEEHPDTLDIMENLALIRFEMDDLVEAETLAKRARQTRDRFLRVDRPGETKSAKLLHEIWQKRQAQGMRMDGDDDSNDSDFGSILSSLGFAGSNSSATSFDNTVFTSAVEVFTASLLRIESFQNICKFALEESDTSISRFQRNLTKALRLFAFHLAQETEFEGRPSIAKFLRSASSRVASQTIQSFGVMKMSGLEEWNVRRLGEKGSRAKILEYLETQDATGVTKHSREERLELETEIQTQSHDDDEIESDSDSDADSIPEGFEGQTIMDDLEKTEYLLFKSNAFLIMEREFHDFVFPSLRSELGKWIAKKRRAVAFTAKQLRDIETVVSELQHIAPDQIFLNKEEDTSIINKIKGKWETFTAETWDWWPLRPYMRPLANGESRLYWRCVSFST